jgi:hypothetical protein
MSSLASREPGPATEKDFDDLFDFAHYTAVNDLRSRGSAEETAADEQLFEIAHFMIKCSAWDPFKQSLLAICLIEKQGVEASVMWNKVLLPLERAYDATNGTEFNNRFGHSFFEPAGFELEAVAGGEEEEEGEGAATTALTPLVASTRSHSEAILAAMSVLAKEAGHPTDTAAQASAKGIMTPKEKAEIDALKKVSQ